MSKREKSLRRLCTTPAPTDFAWDELLAVMRRSSFTETCEGGSHYTFEHVGGFRFSMSKTHPSGLLKRYQIRDAIEALRRSGEIDDD